MRIHYLQHEPYESLGCIENWINEKGFSVTSTKFYEDLILPNTSDFEFLIIMGGPMGVYEEEKYPWLEDEKEFIKDSIESNKKTLGICLGSQLIASALGAKVYPNKFKEIGWFPIRIKNNNNFFNDFPKEIEVFHWHVDTFDLPDGAVHAAENPVCKNQAFIFKDRIVGLQFHFEVTKDSVKKMVAAGTDELILDKYIQPAEKIREMSYLSERNNKLMFKLLDRLVQT
jgi:GMP synthase-like glutamine amidotransferase